jgi:hypothetical protein
MFPYVLCNNQKLKSTIFHIQYYEPKSKHQFLYDFCRALVPALRVKKKNIPKILFEKPLRRN